MDAEIGGKRLQLLRELIPGLARVGVLASTPNTDPFSGPFVEDLATNVCCCDSIVADGP
jgi:hypothetical protein